MTDNWALILGAFVLAFALVARRLRSTTISPAMVFVAFGLLVGNDGLGLLDTSMDALSVKGVVEATLTLVLFADATRIDLRSQRGHWSLPGRLLILGLPLTMIAGAVLAKAMFGGFGWTAAAVLGVMLTPTDAALGEPVVTNPRVPAWVRQGLNVESGLNDGLTVPFFNTAVALLIATELDVTDPLTLAGEALREIGLGVVIGAGVGLVGGWLLSQAYRHNWTGPRWSAVGLAAAAALTYGAAEAAGGNPFIAAFCAGIAVRAASRDVPEGTFGFSDDLASLFTLVSFVLFGAVVLGPALGSVTWTVVLYALMSLTVIRAIPVAISLIHMRVREPTVAYLAWFGPRGIASVLYTFLLVERAGGDPDIIAIVDVVVITVAMSVVLHGLTAAPASERYARWWAARSPDEATEMAESAGAHEHSLGRCAPAEHRRRPDLPLTG